MSKPLQRIVILGHSGFIGTHLERMLQAQEPGIEVMGRSLPEMDLADAASQETLAPLLGAGTAIILCAAVKRQFGDSLEAYHKNMAIVENVAKACVKNSPTKFMFMSSAAVYGEEAHNTAITETTPADPMSYYGLAKFAGECVLRKELLPLGVNLVCLRPPLVYGPGDPGQTYGPSGFSAKAAADETITLWGDGTELREFLYIDDLCAIIRHLTLHSDFCGSVNVVSGSSYSFANVLEHLKKALGKPLEVNQRERSKRKVDNAFTGELLRNLLPAGFAFTPLKDGIERTLEART